MSVNEFDSRKYLFPIHAEETHAGFVADLNKSENVGQRVGEYTVGRPLGEKSEANMFYSKPETYHQALPNFDGQTFEDSLEIALANNGEATYCDIGFGGGVALVDLAEKEPFKTYLREGKLKIVGIGNPNYMKHKFSRPGQEWIIEEPKEATLRELGVQIDGRDLLESLWEMEDDSVDVFTSVITMNWVKYPKIEIIKQINRALKVGGVAFLNDIRLFIADSEQPWKDNNELNFNETMANLGIELNQNFRGIAFRKSKGFENLLPATNRLSPQSVYGLDTVVLRSQDAPTRA